MPKLPYILLLLLSIHSLCKPVAHCSSLILQKNHNLYRNEQPLPMILFPEALCYDTECLRDKAKGTDIINRENRLHVFLIALAVFTMVCFYLKSFVAKQENMPFYKM